RHRKRHDPGQGGPRRYEPPLRQPTFDSHFSLLLDSPSPCTRRLNLPFFARHHSQLSTVDCQLLWNYSNGVNHKRNDRALGMRPNLPRRDLLNGMAIGAGSLLTADPLFAALIREDSAPEKSPNYYPPALIGMRGNHDGSFTYAHAI